MSVEVDYGSTSQSDLWMSEVLPNPTSFPSLAWSKSFRLNSILGETQLGTSLGSGGTCDGHGGSGGDFPVLERSVSS